jgi:hypothetical protein
MPVRFRPRAHLGRRSKLRVQEPEPLPPGNRGASLIRENCGSGIACANFFAHFTAYLLLSN